MQLKTLNEGGSAFSRIKQAYVGCTPADFEYKHPDRVTIKGAFLKKKKQVRLVWTIYTGPAKTTVQRTEALAVQRAGGAVIVTRSIAKVPGGADAKTNVKLTAQQYAKYKKAAYYR